MMAWPCGWGGEVMVCPCGGYGEVMVCPCGGGGEVMVTHVSGLMYDWGGGGGTGVTLCPLGCRELRSHPQPCAEQRGATYWRACPHHPW